VRTVPQVHFVGDNELGVVSFTHLGLRAEEAQQGAVWPQDADQFRCQFVGAALVEIVQKVPAQDAVNGRGLLRQALGQEVAELLETSFSDMAIEIREQIEDIDLTAELLAEEIDVAAYHRSQVDQHGQLAGRQTAQEFPQRLGGKDISRVRRRDNRIGLV